MKRWIMGLILIAIVLAGLATRLGPMFAQRDFWYDEAFTGILLKSSWIQMNDLIFRDVHPPLYYWLAKPWTMLFGLTPGAIRSLSLLFGMLSIPSIYWIGKKMFNENAGLLAAALTALSPFAIIYSSEARMYALFGFLMLWTVWFFYQALTTGQVKYWILWGILGGLCFYTHYLSLFFFLMFYVTALVYQAYSPFNQKNNTIKAKEKNPFWKNILVEKNFWIGTAIIMVFFASWFGTFLKHISRKGLGWVDPAQLSQLPETLQYFFYGHIPGKILAPEPIGFRELSFKSIGINYSSGPIFDSASIGLIVLIFMTTVLTYAWIKNLKKKEMAVLSILSFGTLILLVLLSQVGIKLFVARYFMPAALIIYLLLAGLITEFFTQRWAWVVVLMIYGSTLLLQKPMAYNSGWYQLMQNSNKALGCCSTVIVNNPFDYASAQYYLEPERLRLFNRFDPQQDFSLWIIVGNEKKITDVNKIKQFAQVAIIDDKDCNWDGIDLEEAGQYGQLHVCKLKK